ncbi:hypothetical protein PFICI_09033 [Pestalotiopsis fici W106-1]|uniref:XPG-I domain-containing protein n=1 Tax=Pestalotiopsis fici (strain W106-1 / CGMCC3.15140) TaxID=1229662 RepID=W3WZA1_PESFW|nr:uncharacterized protein PFICI_09033 [Pestalotiopsis fici W106-1]ETS79180.1 hypothetical protein PFICI_09033 [Pestalotiopsis fici W106-1]
MGIKGIYKEIGPGQRISLTKLAIDHLEQTGRPLKVAIDISIWQFQVQAAKGGSNPAIRTLFYRLLRLLSLHIHPIFVFDGPNKPVFKRNKRSGRGNGVAASMAKRMIRLFGFQSHDAPGEAEAECAFLQQNGIVDAVLSEDVDTIMFGCTKTMRNWSAEGKGKTPTHISMYDTAQLKQGGSGLDREGMVLVALMSGGDYLPEGIPGAGVKLACEAARAGFGKSLCRLKRSDIHGLREWKDKLKHELVTNESRLFRTKHKALSVPDDFPNLEVLGYYTHPVVSPLSHIERFRNKSWDNPLDIVGLREFVRETFDWEYQGGAIKFIRVLAPCLLVKKMMQLHADREGRNCEVEDLQREESRLARAITNRREHISTDATPELRVSFTPTEIVGYSFEEEPEEEIAFGRDGIALNSDDEFDGLGDEDGSAAKVGPKKPFNPTEPDLSWIPETIVKIGLPLMVEDWEESQRVKAAKKTKTKVSKTRATVKLGGMQAGALDKFVKVSKDIPATMKGLETLDNSSLACSTRARNPLGSFPATSQKQPVSTQSELACKSTRPSTTHSKQSTRSAKSPKGKGAKAAPPDPTVNPWSIASSRLPSKCNSQPAANTITTSTEAILIASSPLTSPVKHARPRLSREGSSASDRQSSPRSSPSPHKRRSGTPVDGTLDGGVFNHESRPSSPVARQGVVASRRKLARTESMPADSPRGTKNHDVFASQRAPLSRASTISVEPHLGGFDGSDDDNDDDDFGLPPLSSFAGRIPKAPSLPASPRPSFTMPADAMESITVDSSPVLSHKTRTSLGPKPPATSTVPLTKSKQKTAATTTKASKKQGKLDNTFGLRTTKVYAPRKSMPGFFSEMEIVVDETDGKEPARGNSRRWRQSDISFVDLTDD